MTTTATRTTGEAVDAFFAAFGAGDSESLLAQFADTVDFHVSGAPNVPWAGSRSDKGEIAEFFGLFPQLLDGPESFEITTRVTEGQDAVVIANCVFEVTATKKRFANRYALHFTVTDGLIVRYHMFEDSYAIHVAFTP
ncbi:nuclear transport factor 2 family protein [Streptomyces sp. NPDC102451]|uniref:nuclear transport factor 2 family protein n=1 Tax=Streptomyces sp. NPDC102451 TaxID=3366177 RepID=UPI0037F359B4